MNRMMAANLLAGLFGTSGCPSLAADVGGTALRKSGR